MKNVLAEDLNVKFLVMLRDPVARAYSQYQMAIDTAGTPEQMKLRGQTCYTGKTFEEIIEEEIAALEAAGLEVPLLLSVSLPHTLTPDLTLLSCP
jgi:hypothetical protein